MKNAATFGLVLAAGLIGFWLVLAVVIGYLDRLGDGFDLIR